MSLPTLKAAIKRLRPGATAAALPDCRGGRFVAVIDCILNQNVRDIGAASFPEMNFELLALCHELKVGVMQMPCPEIMALGFHRERPPGVTIRQALDTEAGRQRCSDLAAAVAEQIQTALAAGSRLMAVLGGNTQSPGCAVHGDKRGLLIKSGIFMQELQRELRLRGIDAPFRGMRDASPELLAEDMQWLRNLLVGGQAPGQISPE